jgi:hypothetical protein
MKNTHVAIACDTVKNIPCQYFTQHDTTVSIQQQIHKRINIMINYIPLATKPDYLPEVNWVRFADFRDWEEFEGLAYEIPKERIEQALLLLDDPAIYELVESEMLKDWEDANELNKTNLITEDLKHPIRIAYLIKNIPYKGVHPVSIDNISRSCSKIEDGHHRLLALEYLGCKYFPVFLGGYVENFPVNSKLPPMEYIACGVSTIRTGFEKITAIFRLCDSESVDGFLMPLAQNAIGKVIEVKTDDSGKYADIIMEFNNITQLEVFRWSRQSDCKYKCFFVCKYQCVDHQHLPLVFGYFDSETPFKTYGDTFPNNQITKHRDTIFMFDETIFESAQSFANIADGHNIDVSLIFNLAINVDD